MSLMENEINKEEFKTRKLGFGLLVSFVKHSTPVIHRWIIKSVNTFKALSFFVSFKIRSL